MEIFDSSEPALCTQCKNGRNGILICHACCGTTRVQNDLTGDERREKISEALRLKLPLHPVTARIKAGLPI